MARVWSIKGKCWSEARSKCRRHRPKLDGLERHRCVAGHAMRCLAKESGDDLPSKEDIEYTAQQIHGYEDALRSGAKARKRIKGWFRRWFGWLFGR